MTHPQDTASKLADYYAMRDSMIEFLWSLRRGRSQEPTLTIIGGMIAGIEYSMLWAVNLPRPNAIVAASVFCANRPAAQQAIDNHFAEYIERERKKRGGAMRTEKTIKARLEKIKVSNERMRLKYPELNIQPWREEIKVLNWVLGIKATTPDQQQGDGV